MDMDMGSGESGFVPLNDTGVDFSNETQAFDFLGEILDDSFLQVDSNSYARAFWYGTVVIITIAAIANVAQRQILRSRLRSVPASKFTLNTAVGSVFATSTAICREISYLQWSPSQLAPWLRLPTFGASILIAFYIAFILGLEFTNNDYPGAQHDQALSIRAGWLAVAQVPLIVLLAGKNNIIGLLTGVSYQRLNVLHRWTARGLLILATMHFAFQSRGWSKFGLMQLEWDTDSCPPTGIAAYAFLLWINISTLAPFRRLSYEFFVVQHILTFFGFIIAIMMHLPSTALYTRVYIYMPIALWFVDRLIRSARSIVHNLTPAQAALTPLDGSATMVRISSKHVKRWSAGSHVLLSIPRLGFLQSHPATIMSTPSSHDGELVFVLKSHKGFTRNLLRAAKKSQISSADTEAGSKPYTAFIDGPYASSHFDFACFDSVLLIAGGTGVTFTLSVLLDLSNRAANQTMPLRVVNFVWAVKKEQLVSAIARDITRACEKLRRAGIEVNILTFATVEAITVSVAEKAGDGQSDVENLAIDTSGSKKPEVTTDASSSDDGASIRSASGRPDVDDLLRQTVVGAQGETGVGACGPLEMVTAMRRAVVKLSDERAVCKGTGAQGIYLHVESCYS